MIVRNYFDRIALKHCGAAALVAALAATAPAIAQETPAPAIKEATCAGIVPAEDVVSALARELYRAYQNGDISAPVEQTKITYPYLALMAPDINDIPEDPIERVSIGEALFLNFRAVEARMHFSALMQRDDLVGRIAWQRMMQMAFTPEDGGAAMQKMLAEYRERFPPSLLDIAGAGQQVRNLSVMHAANGEIGKALDLVIEELTSLPANAPYQGYRLAEAFQSSFEEAGRGAELKTLLKSKLKKLRAARSEMERLDPPASQDPILVAGAPAWYWTWQGIQPGETFHAARLRQMQALESKLEALAK